MSQFFPSWLTKQMVQGVKGFNLDAYLLALEGWRRGLTLKWYSDDTDATNIKIIGFNPVGKMFSLSSKEKRHFFYRSRGDKVSNKAVDITSNKATTKKYLQENKIPIPMGKRFTSEDSITNIIKAGATIGYPLVLKPTFGSLGKGVVTDIQNEVELIKAIDHVKCVLNYQDIILERFIEGDDLRVYVVGEKVLGATKRVPANVIGDGYSTIEKLIEDKNKIRAENQHLSSKLIEIDQEVLNYLKRKNYNLQSIPDKNERVCLRGQSNIAAGGDPIDFTDEITDQIKTLAVKAVKAIPGLHQAGVDIIYNKHGAFVIELNATADIMMHFFPMFGKPRNVAKGIIDFYFPETKENVADQTKIYFDYKKINTLLKNGLINEIELNDAPSGALYAKRYVVSGRVQNVGYRNWVRKRALKQNLHGYARNLKNGKVVVVVGSEDQDKVDRFKDVLYKGPLKAEVKSIEEYTWDKQLKLGFEIRKSRY